MNERITTLQSKATNHGFALALKPLELQTADGFDDHINAAKDWQLDKASETLDSLIKA